MFDDDDLFDEHPPDGHRPGFWPPRLRSLELHTLASKKDVQTYRAIHRIPEDETCPRWIECNCRIGSNGKVEPEKRGAVQQVWGHAPYCLKCGGLL